MTKDIKDLIKLPCQVAMLERVECVMSLTFEDTQVCEVRCPATNKKLRIIQPNGLSTFEKVRGVLRYMCMDCGHRKC